MKKISHMVVEKHPEGGYTHTCPIDKRECDKVNIHDNITSICGHGRWETHTGYAPCEESVEERKKRRIKTKTKRKIKKCKCK